MALIVKEGGLVASGVVSRLGEDGTLKGENVKREITSSLDLTRGRGFKIVVGNTLGRTISWAGLPEGGGCSKRNEEAVGLMTYR